MILPHNYELAMNQDDCDDTFRFAEHFLSSQYPCSYRYRNYQSILPRTLGLPLCRNRKTRPVKVGNYYQIAKYYLAVVSESPLERLQRCKELTPEIVTWQRSLAWRDCGSADEVRYLHGGSSKESILPRCTRFLSPPFLEELKAQSP